MKKDWPIDPVCNMSVNPTSKLNHTYEGTKYFFCNPKCLEKFSQNPKKYLEKVEVIADPNDKSLYTCPMHPEVQNIGPGSCPDCGMALEPMIVTLEDDTTELDDLKQRLFFAIPFALPLILFEMLAMFHIHIIPMGATWREYLLLALCTPVMLWSGKPLWEKAFSSFVSGNLNMFSLIGLGTWAAYLHSILAVFVPNIFPPVYRTLSHDGVSLPIYFEAAVMITILVLIGQVLEVKARLKTSDALKSLLRLVPQKAIRVTADGDTEEVDAKAINVGDLLLIKAGEKVPVDGILYDGETFIDESMLTGEPLPVEKRKGSKLYAATINGNQTFYMTAKQVGHTTVLSQIVQLVSQAQRSKAPIQKIADRISSYFVPAVIFSSLITFAIWAFWGPEPRLIFALINSVAVLIVACPCALGLATPMSISVALGRAAQAGILFKSSESLEILSTVNTILLDKTGTLTKGKPSLKYIEPINGIEKEFLLKVAAVENNSKHPIALAIMEKVQGMKIPKAENVKTIPGSGMEASIDGKVLKIGNRNLVTIPSNIEEKINEIQKQGATVLFVSEDDKYIGYLAVVDEIRDESHEVIQALRANGIRIAMLTGDNKATAEHVAAKLGITEVYSEVLPAMKQKIVEKLKNEKCIVAMIGDGINDAPALAAANVGIAMGAGTDVAIETGGITLLNSRLASLLIALKLSKSTMKNIRQNLFFAFFYNSLGVPVAAGIFYPIFGLLLSPVLASSLMSMSSLFVIGNSLRLRKFKF